MRIGICDDDIRDCELLEGILKRLKTTDQIETYTSAADLLAAAEIAPAFDLIFLDIYMPGECGLSTAKKLRDRYISTSLVFCTTSADHALEAFHLGMVHYLVKPVSAEAVGEAVARAKRIRAVRRPMLSVKVGRQMRLLYLDEIATITMASHEAVVSMTDGRTISFYASMASLQEQLNDSFITLSRGIIVNMAYIVEMSATECVLRDGRTILLSRGARADIRKAYNAYVFQCLSSQRHTKTEDQP